MSVSQTKVVFPPPPPTTNSLTASQRTQLLRKTKKLEQILGATPHLLDLPSIDALAPVHISFPSNQKSRPSSVSHRTRSSIDSFSSSSSSSSSPLSSCSPYSSSSSVYSTMSSTPPASLLSRRGSTLRKPNPQPLVTPAHPAYETWSDSKPPFLRLNLSSDIFSPQPTGDTKPFGPSDKHNRYTMAPPIPRTAKQASCSPVAPSFNMASMGSTRKSKMDRIRKKLGNDVPIELVFPQNESGTEDSESSASPRPSPEILASFVFPPPNVPRTRKMVGTIAGSRNSLTEETIHRARRRQPAPSPPVKGSRQDALLAIVESPEEHGFGCAEDFGLTRSRSTGSQSLGSTESYGKEDEAKIKIWSTRRGVRRLGTTVF